MQRGVIAMPTIAPTPKPSKPAPTALPSPALADVLKDSAAIPNKAVAAAVLTVLIIITPVLTSSIREYTCDYGRASVQQPSPGAIGNFCLTLLLARLTVT